MPDSVCDRCHAQTSTQYSTFIEFIGMLVVIRKQLHAGNYCRQCTRALFWRSMLINFTIGLLSWMSIVITPITAVINTIAHRRAMRRFDGGDQPLSEVVRRLPWSSRIGALDTGSIGHAPLTPSSLAFGLSFLLTLFWFVSLVLVLIFSAIGPLDPPPARPRSPEEDARVIENLRQSRNIVLMASPIVLALFGASLYWRWRSQHPRGDIEDVLAKLFPASTILQLPHAHLTALGWQRPGGFRVLVAAQNRFDSPSIVQLSTGEPSAPAHVQVEMPGGGAAVAVVDLPVNERAVRPVTMVLIGQSSGLASRRVRSAQRAMLTSSSREQAFALAGALAGHGAISRGPPPLPVPSFFDRLGKLQTVLVPVAGLPLFKPNIQVSAFSMDRASPDELASVLLAACDG